MKLELFAIRDAATDQFGTPMFLLSAGQALRSFTDEVNRVAADNLLSSHPEDYALYQLGSFDTATGLFSTSPPLQVVLAKSVRLNGSA